MKKGTVVNQNDIKRILAEYFGVPEENIIKAQYSYNIAPPKSTWTLIQQQIATHVVLMML